MLLPTLLLLSINLAVLPAAVSAAPAADFNRGRLLYENHCIGCHESVLHIRERRIVTSRPALVARVEHYAKLQRLRWDSDDINDVVLYLDRRFYKFEPGPRGG